MYMHEKIASLNDLIVKVLQLGYCLTENVALNHDRLIEAISSLFYLCACGNDFIKELLKQTSFFVYLI